MMARSMPAADLVATLQIELAAAKTG
jgi:hypothetical protein